MIHGSLAYLLIAMDTPSARSQLGVAVDGPFISYVVSKPVNGFTKRCLYGRMESKAGERNRPACYSMTSPLSNTHPNVVLKDEFPVRTVSSFVVSAESFALMCCSSRS